MFLFKYYFCKVNELNKKYLTTHEKYIKRCIQIANNGLGTTYPNPNVGCVIVYNNTIIGEGFTSPYGGPHAEVNAINSVVNNSLLKKATLYVTLEPCSHYGKTPPCANLIIQKQIPNVVIGVVDSHSAVAGKGIQKLKEAGCNVTVGVLQEECLKHHKRFFTFHNKKRPFIILKWAQTQDGFIAPAKETRNKKQPVWISNAYAKQLVHQWRSQEHAILVGTNTVLEDNPKLTTRLWEGNNPIRVVLDSNLKIDGSYYVTDGKTPTIIITDISKIDKVKTQKNCTYKHIDFTKNIAQQICNVLTESNIQSIIIEGGAQTLQTFIDANLWDEARVFTGNTSFTKGVAAPSLPSNQTETIKLKNNTLTYYINHD